MPIPDEPNKPFAVVFVGSMDLKPEIYLPTINTMTGDEWPSAVQTFEVEL